MSKRDITDISCKVLYQLNTVLILYIYIYIYIHTHTHTHNKNYQATNGDLCNTDCTTEVSRFSQWGHSNLGKIISIYIFPLFDIAMLS